MNSKTLKNLILLFSLLLFSACSQTEMGNMPSNAFNLNKALINKPFKIQNAHFDAATLFKISPQDQNFSITNAQVFITELQDSLIARDNIGHCRFDLHKRIATIDWLDRFNHTWTLMALLIINGPEKEITSISLEVIYVTKQDTRGQDSDITIFTFREEKNLLMKTIASMAETIIREQNWAVSIKVPSTLLPSSS